MFQENMGWKIGDRHHIYLEFWENMLTYVQLLPLFGMFLEHISEVTVNPPCFIDLGKGSEGF